MRFASFLALGVLAVSVDPTKLPPFVWLVAVVVAVAWWATFKPDLPERQTYLAPPRYLSGDQFERKRPIGFGRN